MIFKKHSIVLVLLAALLIMCGSGISYGQASPDTLVINNSDLESPIFYSADDSIYADLRNEIIHLYGNATVDDGDINLKAGYIMIDLNRNEVLASYRVDPDSGMVELPIFTDGSDEIVAQKIRYNFDTEKAYIEELAIQQDENFLYMGVAKRQTNEEIHFRNGRFTSCNLEEPHYHFQLSKAVLVPDKRIVTGPMNLWIQGVPTPLGLPFSIIPQSEDKTQGLMFPEIVMPSKYGFGLQDLGYYIPINNSLQTTFYGTLYSRGSWGLRNVTDYAVRYKFKGNFNVGFQQFRSGFPDNRTQNKSTVIWQHRKEAQSNPLWDFSSNVNFISDNQSKNSLDPNNTNYFNNTLSSDIIVSRNFPSKPVRIGAKLSLRQNSISQKISLASPVVNVNVSRITPFENVIGPGGKGFKEFMRRLSVNYNFEGQNQALFADTLLQNKDFRAIGSSFLNGVSQNTTVQSTAGLFKNALKITPSFFYANYINFQQVEKSFDGTEYVDSIVQNTGMAHDIRFNASMTTVLYSYYNFVGKNKPILRHVLTPSFTYSYRPNLNTNDTLFANSDTLVYSPFGSSLYRISSTQTQKLLTFGINNTFELKRKSDKDTVDGFKRTRIIDALTFNGSYDFNRLEKKLSNISSSIRISPIPWINVVASTTFSPYNWNDTTGAELSTFAIRERGVLGRFVSSNITTTLTITSKAGRKRLRNAVDNIEQNWNADFNYYYLHPEQFLDFEIPWKLSFSHVYGIDANQSISSFDTDKWNQLQTLMVNGDVSFTARWKLSTRTNFDLKTSKITNSRISLVRNMHCWMLSFDWTPIGLNKSFIFTLRSTSALLQDIPINFRRPPTFL